MNSKHISAKSSIDYILNGKKDLKCSLVYYKVYNHVPTHYKHFLEVRMTHELISKIGSHTIEIIIC